MTGSLSSQLAQLLSGLGVTLQLTVVSTTLGIFLGLVLALLVSSPRKVVRWLAIAIVEFGRGAPADRAPCVVPAARGGSGQAPRGIPTDARRS